MRRVFFSILSLFLAFTASAQYHQRIELTDNQTEPVEIPTDVCKIFVSRSPTSNDNVLNLTVDVENTDDRYYILLFGHGFDEKALKKAKPYSIRFDKTSYGVTSKNIIPIKDSRGEELVLIEPAGIRHTFYIERSEGKLEIALYLAEYKPKKFLSSEKLLIKKRVLFDIDIDVKLSEQADEELERLNEEYEELMEELKEKTFCPNSNHRPSLTEQITPYKNKIQEMLSAINDLKKKNKWRDRDEAYAPYKELKEKLEQIEYRKKDCGNDGPVPIPPHRCSYCNLSPSGAENQIERIYMQYDQGKITKSEAIRKAKAMRSCPKLAKTNNFDSYYNRIVK